MDNSKDIRPKNEGRRILIFVVLLVVLLGGAYLSSKFEKGARAEKIDFDLYAMSQCPYGTQAEEVVLGAMSGFEEYINFNVEYIADKNEDGSFSSLHGQPEVEGNLYQLCVKENYADKFWSYLECQNRNYQDLKSSFESCANEVGANYEVVKNCAEGDEGAELLTASSEKAKALKVAGSPTFYLDNEIYTGPRTEIALQRSFCRVLEDEPKICGELPQDKEFTAYLLTDSRCTKPECDTTKLKEQLISSFSKIKFEELDYNNKKGKEFYEKYELTYLPAVLFSQEIKETDNYSQLERYLREVDDLFNLAIGAVHDPSKEICDNGEDDTGNGLVDCADNDCEASMECREEIAQRLDLFVMSMCPFGTQAMDAMKEVLDNFGDNIDFHINYIANENPDGSFQSLHGQPEVDENIRELCAMKYYPKKYMEYAWCRNQDIQGDWQACAADLPAIGPCAESDEGKRLHSQNIKLSNDLGIGASPTWMVNNKYIFSGIDAEVVRENYCKYNEVAGCENTLSGQASGDVAAGGSCN